jgi:hypothetical protein
VSVDSFQRVDGKEEFLALAADLDGGQAAIADPPADGRLGEA